MNWNKIARVSGLVVSIIGVIYFGAAFVMIYADEPTFKPGPPPKMDAAQIADLGFEQVYENTTHKFIMRDGAELFTRRYVQSSNLTIVLIHGVLANSFTYNKMSGLLREAANAEVFSVDLRGHGQSSGRPGDVDYDDQYADDIADVVAAIRKDKPHGKIILAGHSMGGGISLRFAMKSDALPVDGYLLVAPLLSQMPPTLRLEPLEGAVVPEEPFMKLHIPRILGLAMLNLFGLEHFNDMPTMFFNLPAGTPLREYTFRAGASMSPEDHKAGLAAVDKPLLVVVGDRDEVFLAEAFESTVSAHSDGEVVIIKNATHNGIRHSDGLANAVKKWVQKELSVEREMLSVSDAVQ